MKRCRAPGYAGIQRAICEKTDMAGQATHARAGLAAQHRGDPAGCVLNWRDAAKCLSGIPLPSSWAMRRMRGGARGGIGRAMPRAQSRPWGRTEPGAAGICAVIRCVFWRLNRRATNTRARDATGVDDQRDRPPPKGGHCSPRAWASRNNVPYHASKEV